MMLHGREGTIGHSSYKHNKEHKGERNIESLWNSAVDVLSKPGMIIKDASIVLGFLFRNWNNGILK